MIRTLSVAHTMTRTQAGNAAVESALLETVTRDPHHGYFLTSVTPGEGVRIGRYHAAPRGGACASSDGDSIVSVNRRRTGGRVMPTGEGFLGISMVLPHRAALVGDDWRALGPEQVMNRCVRGILHALNKTGVPAFYPGRDLITVAGRTLGVLSFETTPQHALAFDAMIALDRSLAVLPHRLDAVDPAGVIAAPMWAAAEAVTVADACGRPVAVAELVERMWASYRELFNLEIVPDDAATGAGATVDDDREREWLQSRTPRAELGRRGTVSTGMGLLETYVARDGDRLCDVMLVGDFIANAEAVEALEARLSGTHVDWAGISAIAASVFSRPGSYILGIDSLSKIADAVCAAV